MSNETRLGRNELGDITISITGEALQLTGWSGLQVVRALDSCADGFSFSFPWEATKTNRDRWRAYRTTSCVVRYQGQTVISGIIEKISSFWSAQRRELAVEGRSRSGLLLDLSAEPVELTADFNAIAARLSPDVSVIARPDIEDVSVQIDAGKDIYGVLSGIAAGRGYWGQPQSDGWLLFSKIRATPPIARLIEGESPLVSIETAHDLTKRFYRYRTIVTVDGKTSSGEAIDRGVDPARDGQIVQTSSSADAIEAATFQRSRGIIDGYTCVATVIGWTNGTSLWAPGQTVEVEAPSAMMYNRSTLIVKHATFQLDESGGAITELDLTFPQIYSGSDITAAFPYPWSRPELEQA